MITDGDPLETKNGPSTSSSRVSRSTGTTSTSGRTKSTRHGPLGPESGVKRAHDEAKRMLAITPQKYLDPVGSPSGYPTSEKIGVLCPDGTAKGQGRGQNRPIFWIPLANPFAGFRLELPVG